MNHYSTHSDAQLVALLKDSDNGAFTELFDRYWQKLLLVAGNKLDNLGEAQELVQDIFLDIWQRRKELSITGAGGIKVYLAVAVKYRVINVLAKRHRTERYARELRAHSTPMDHSLEEWLSFEELKHRLAALVAELPEKRRIVYQLSREEGYTRKEIAQSLNITEKTVESHLTRALHSIKSGLTQLFSTLFTW